MESKKKREASGERREATCSAAALLYNTVLAWGRGGEAHGAQNEPAAAGRRGLAIGNPWPVKRLQARVRCEELEMVLDENGGEPRRGLCPASSVQRPAPSVLRSQCPVSSIRHPATRRLALTASMACVCVVCVRACASRAIRTSG